jgi:2-polyprenyl-3-methyl-5-hydroxy-6-metoxy-1,4-benzoquinol methylase
MIDITTCVICNGTIFLNDKACKDYTVSKDVFTLIKCTSCDFTITSPRPNDEELGNYYISEDYISHSNETKSITDKIYAIARNYTLKWKTKLIEKHTKNTIPSILDFGAGTGTFVKACADKGWKTKGVEPSKIARYAGDPSIKEFLTENLKGIKEKDFDVITLWHVLEHVPDVKQTLKDLIERVKDSGYLFIAVPNKNSYDAKAYGNYWAGYDVPRHLWHFSQENMKTLMASEGLTVEKIVPMKLDSFYVSLLSANYKYPNQKLLNLIRGFIVGLTSNINATIDGEYSSLLYIIKK